MNKFEEIINGNYPSTIINKFTGLNEPLVSLHNQMIMAPEYIFIEDHFMTDMSYSILRKICRLEKVGETHIIIFGRSVDELDRAKAKNCKVSFLRIDDYNSLDLQQIKESLKQNFSRSI
ncbi:response regulator [Mucilaginibacter polytrichastri]|nr:hypothetical protein [Mucilaginibacter polytrichastri]